MGDVALIALWGAVLAGGLAACVLLRHLGVPRTHVRDLLHVGAGVWVLGWPWWTRPWAPVGITLLALAGVAAVPLLAGRVRWLGRLEGAVAGGGEQWSGIVLYTLAFAALTAAGLWGAPFPAAAALLALALGDGVGGAVGLRFGRHHYRLPGAKPKSLEGTAAVALMASTGVAVASTWFGAAVGLPWVLAAGVLAAVVEALSPRATDNLLLPAAVWLLLGSQP